MSGELSNLFLRNRAVGFLSALGLIGMGAVVGAGSVYIFYIRNKFQDIFRTQSTLSTQIQCLKKEVEKVCQNLAETNGSPGTSHSSSSFSSISGSEVKVQKSSMTKSTGPKKVGAVRRTVRFRDGYETADDDEYITASSDSEIEIEMVPQESSNSSSTNNLDIPMYKGADSWITEFLQEADKLLDGNASSQHDAYVRLQKYEDKLEHLCGFWWRFAKATYMEAAAVKGSGDAEQHKSLTFAGFDCAKRALELDDSSPNAHKWYAITLGSKGDFVPIKEKIQNGYVFKDHVDRAIQLNPTDPSLHYLLGRFCFEVSQLSWMERKIASTLFSSPPDSTPEEALKHFETSEKLGRPLKDNRLYMAKCFMALRNYEKAAYWLNKTVEMDNVSSSDKPAHEEAVQLFTKYRQYLQ